VITFAKVIDADKRAAAEMVVTLEAAGKLADRETVLKALRAMAAQVVASRREAATRSTKSPLPDGSRVRAESKDGTLSIYLQRRGERRECTIYSLRERP
jgi:hypothetical protein